MGHGKHQPCILPQPAPAHPLSLTGALTFPHVPAGSLTRSAAELLPARRLGRPLVLHMRVFHRHT